MIDFEISLKRTRVLKLRHKWFHGRPTGGDRFKLVLYLHCKDVASVPGFYRQPKFTLLVDLKQPADAILGQFVKNTRYEVNRVMKEGARFELEKERNAFRSFYNEFAASKNLGALEDAVLDAYWPRMVVTKTMLGDEAVAMHSYLFDEQCQRAVLLQTASLFRNMTDGQQRSLVGRANRWLHYQDMLWFKERGAASYDFGGYAQNTTDPELEKINQFKSGFGGSVIEESHYLSNALFWMRRLSAWVTAVRTKASQASVT